MEARKRQHVEDGSPARGSSPFEECSCLDSQRPVIMGYALSSMGYFGVSDKAGHAVVLKVYTKPPGHTTTWMLLACSYGLPSIKYGLLWSIVASILSYLVFQPRRGPRALLRGCRGAVKGGSCSFEPIT